MSDMRDVVVTNATRVFADLCTGEAHVLAERGEWQPSLWTVLEDAGFPYAAHAPARGGPGTDFGDALALVRAAGACHLPAPLAETMLAELVLAAAALPPLRGSATVAPVVPGDSVSLTRVPGGWRLTGLARRIPWGRHVDAIVFVGDASGTPAAALVRPKVALRADRNFANEPRDTLVLDGLRIADEDVAVHASCLSAQDLRTLGASFRVAAMTGAMETALEMSLSYAMERKQFGRPIAKFQAVQHQIAIMASQVAAANAATDAMIEAVGTGNASFEIAAAKLRVGEAAGIVAGIAHQVHGAMGFSLDHPLHRCTRRLWSWRDEFGSEHEWAEVIGDIVARLGHQELWPFLTSSAKHVPL